MDKLRFYEDLKSLKNRHLDECLKIKQKYPHNHQGELRALAKYYDLEARIDGLKTVLFHKFKYEEKMMEQMFGVEE